MKKRHIQKKALSVSVTQPTIFFVTLCCLLSTITKRLFFISYSFVLIILPFFLFTLPLPPFRLLITFSHRSIFVLFCLHVYTTRANLLSFFLFSTDPAFFKFSRLLIIYSPLLFLLLLASFLFSSFSLSFSLLHTLLPPLLALCLHRLYICPLSLHSTRTTLNIHSQPTLFTHKQR